MMISLFTIVIQFFFCFSVSSQTASSNRFKRIDYEYDLVSGKVNKVSYQKDSADQFIHQYSYDSDNRITKVETSSDNVVWDVDAKYFYYAHGPLARTEIGNDKVQGIDYAYTLQGWIKGVNSNTLDKKRDMGQDGKDTSIYDPSNPQLHANFAQDAFGYSLNYFKGDYKAISQVRWSNTTNRFEAVTTGSDLMASRHDLHNGNISSMVTTIVKPTITPGDTMQFVPLPQGTAYKYDQLNRLVEMKAWQNLNSTNNTWGTGLTYNGMYNNKFSYDANGNILTALAKNQSGQTIDDQTYHQQTLAGKKVRNRTYAITDLATQTSGNDLLNQTPFDNNDATINMNNNYSFTEIGERKSDKQDSIDLIIWTTYGKIKEVKRTPGCSKMNVKFRYDPQGNTISKHLYKSDDTTWLSSEYYIRDAQGNLLTVYKKQIIGSSFSYSKTENHIYGSGLIGIDRTEKQLIGSGFLSNQSGSCHLIGKKDYSGDNHLGNVLVTFTDKKLPVDYNNDNVVDYYFPIVVSSNDYAPFGSLLTERTFNKGGYPNSFNGKRDLEGLNFQDYGMRIYNPMERIFPSLDPLSSKYPELSKYQFASNRTTDGIDKDGSEWENIKAAAKVAIYGIDALKIKRVDDGFGNVQTQLYTLKATGNAADFAKVKEVMTNHPEKITNNFYASYSAFQKADENSLSAGDEIKIDIAAMPAPVFVRVMNVQSDDKSFSMTFATLEGHAEAGYITFSGILNDDGTIEVNIFNETRENFGAGAVGPSRAVQQDQWEDVMGNLKNFIGNDDKGKSKTIEMVEHIEEYKYDETKAMGKGELIDSKTEVINE